MHIVPGMSDTLVGGGNRINIHTSRIDQPDLLGPLNSFYINSQPGTASSFHQPQQKLCALGFYCPEGSGEPIPCPPHTMAATLGAQKKEDCGPCPPGQWCKAGEAR